MIMWSKGKFRKARAEKNEYGELKSGVEASAYRNGAKN